MELNSTLPNWDLLPIFGNKIPKVTDFKGKPLLILFFNLGCPSCKGRALPFANSIIVDKGNKINIIGIHSNFEGSEYTTEDFETVKKEFYVRFPLYKDNNNLNTFRAYQAGGTPHWILLNKEGKIEYSIFGSDPNNALLRLDLKINEIIAN